MFGEDFYWNGERTSAHEEELDEWLQAVAVEGGRLAVVELGAGHAIPTVRFRAEYLTAAVAGTRRRATASLIRINADPADAAVPAGTGVALAGTALLALTAIEARLLPAT